MGKRLAPNASQVGQRFNVSASDCCLSVQFTATLVEVELAGLIGVFDNGVRIDGPMLLEPVKGEADA